MTFHLVVFFHWYSNEWGEVWHVYGLTYINAVQYERPIQIFNGPREEVEPKAAVLAHSFGVPVVQSAPTGDQVRKLLKLIGEHSTGE